MSIFAKKKLEMFEDQYGLHFNFSWMSTSTYFLAFFALFWNAILIFWYGAAFASGAPFVFFVFPILHLLVGLSVAYTVLTNFVNKTKIDLVGDQLTIKHGPIPWFRGDKEIDINQIKQFYVKEARKSKQNDTIIYNYEIWGILRDGNRIDLTKGVNMESDYALEVEQKLEKYLGIPDRPVKGAYGNIKYNDVHDDIEEMEEPLDLEDLKNRPEREIEYRKKWNDEDLV